MLKEKKTKHCETKIEYSEIQNKRQCEKIIKISFYYIWKQVYIRTSFIFFTVSFLIFGVPQITKKAYINIIQDLNNLMHCTTHPILKVYAYLL